MPTGQDPSRAVRGERTSANAASGRPLRILIVHNRYRFRGGEDTVVDTEANLLRSFGHDVEEHIESNDEPFDAGDMARLFWSPEAKRKLERVLDAFRPDVVHCHNIFYRITPSTYGHLHHYGAPIVQTLHNFRFGCINGSLMRGGLPCELCLCEGGSLWPGVRHSCFHNSALQSIGLAASLKFHSFIGSLSRVETFIALSKHARSKHILYGIPEAKLVVKPNCIHPDPGFPARGGAGFCLVAGRLSAEKGMRTVLAVAGLLPREIEVWIAGEGPMEDEVRHAADTFENIRFLGPLPRLELLDLMKKAKCLIFASLAYENFPMTIAEAFSVGLPVIASRRGAAAEIIQGGVTGMMFEPDSSESLAAQIVALWSDAALIENIRKAARLKYAQSYSGEATYWGLMEIYGKAIRNRTAEPRNA